MKKCLILPVDGKKNIDEIAKVIDQALKTPEEIGAYVSHIKFNDATHLHKFDNFLHGHKERYPNLNIFWDLKLPDTNGTDVNILKHYIDYMKPRDIVTISGICSRKAFLDVRRILPSGVKIALVSVLTDTDREECRRRRGMVPEMAILNDAINLIEELSPVKPFDLVICSPADISFLKANLPQDIEFGLPAIRDSWMDAGQQSKDRINGVAEAIDMGADFVIMGSQLTKGNPEKGINAEQSRVMTMDRIKTSKRAKLIKGDPLQTLTNLKGYYKCPEDENGNFIGHLVTYSGTYKAINGEKNYVGNTYFNLSVIEPHPIYLEYFAETLAEEIRKFEKETGKVIDCLVGVPEGGTKIAHETGNSLRIPGIRLERKVTALKTETRKEKFDLVLRRNQGIIQPGDNVLLVEDLCNNFSTTAKAIDAIHNNSDGTVVGIACVVNRSKTYTKAWQGFPIIACASVPSDQYQQEDLEVAGLIAEGKLSTDPKADWERLRAQING